MKNYKEMEERANERIARMEEILDGAMEEKRELTDDEAQEIAEIRDDVKKIKDALEAYGMMKDAIKGDGAEEGEAMNDAREKKDEKNSVEEQERRAFDAYLRKRVNERADDAVVMTKGANGAVIPQTIANKIISTVYDICPILERSSKYNVKGKLEIPYYAEDSNGAITVAYANEFEELESNVGSFGRIELDGFLAGALALISRSLINNSQFNIVDFVIEKMAYAIKRFIEGELLNGTSGKVTGLSTVTKTVTTDSSIVITADELIDLHDSIKDDFQSGAIWIMSPATRTAVRKLKATTGEYLFNDDISSPFGASILGKPVYVSDNMPDIEAGKVAIYYGDMKGLATKFSEDMEIEVLREKYSTQHAVGVVGWLEFDGKIENQQMLAKLVMKAQ